MELCPDAARWETAEVGLSLISPDEIRELNREHRGVDEATDVLSFPMWEEEGRFVPQPAGPVLPLGDIVICRTEAARLHPNLTEREAFCLTLAHSFLHLLAWDHDTIERQQAMWDRQDALKSRLLDALEEREDA